MLGTLLRRVTVKTLDRVVDKGRNSERTPVRIAVDVIDRARGFVGLDGKAVEVPLPQWEGEPADRPMWNSDRNKLRKWQLDQGIVKEEGGEAPAKPVEPAVVVYFKRGCPYCRAAFELLREREIPFLERDVTTDVQTREWLKTVTGRKTQPQIFVHGAPIGGYDELRALDQSGELAKRIAAGPAVPTEQAKPDAPAGVDDSTEGSDSELDVESLRARIEDGNAALLDVRTEAEVARGVIEGALHLPLGELAARANDLDPDAVWIAYCQSGQRSMAAVNELRNQGFRSVVSLRGGVGAWTAAGGQLVSLQAAPRQRVRLPVVHPERSPFEDLLDAWTGEGTERLEGDALVTRVREVLDECRPLVQADGGDIELVDVIGDVVHLQLTGNCIGCPSAQATLRQGIERRLKSRIPQLEGIASPQL